MNVRTRIARLSLMLVMIAATSGCRETSQVAAKSPTVQLAEVSLYSSSEGLRYSASILPFAQASLSFKSPGFRWDLKKSPAGAEARTAAETEGAL
jgi:hypothetical protein